MRVACALQTPKRTQPQGAEIIRLYHTLLGPEGFRKGTDLYFKRHDGQVGRWPSRLSPRGSVWGCVFARAGGVASF